jgi:hypothetical protein
MSVSTEEANLLYELAAGKCFFGFFDNAPGAVCLAGASSFLHTC